MVTLTFIVLFFAGIIHWSSQITTIHHDKPEESTIPIMATSMTDKKNLNITLTSSERQKRLLPYINFYHDINNKPDNYVEKYQPPPRQIYPQQNEYHPNSEIVYQQKVKYTPFLESNALPGGFKPMVSNAPQRTKVPYDSLPQTKVPNFGELYDKLAQLKLSQNYRRPSYVPIKRPVQQNTYILKQQVYNRPKVVQPPKTTIETYTATNIDIPSGEQEQRHYYEQKPYINTQIVEIPLPQKNYNTKYYEGVRKPFIIIPAGSPEEPSKQYIVVHRKPGYTKKPIPNYIQITPQHKEIYQINTPKYVEETYEEFPQYQSTPKYIEDTTKYQPTPSYIQETQPQSKNVINLSIILKHLQSTNVLPKTLTPENIDNSINTLMKILNALKKQSKPSKPVIVQEPPPEYIEDIQNEAGVGISGHPSELPGDVNEAYPEDTDEGGTPGRPGVDYPALSSIPQTTFNCKTQRYKGFFGDPDTNCQVWHYCDLNGGQASFLCPNGTIFSQVALTCDWWYNVKCSTTAQLYVLNERLYKYIIPLSPKFPEDYTGPLVDKYLALKFQEMEDKMKKEKKGKGNSENESSSEEEQEANVSEKVETSTKVVKIHEKETLDTVEDDNLK